MRRTAAPLLLLCLAAVSPAQATLKIGSQAPKIRVADWAKGSPVESFKPGKVYVVEFWATWCGPCIEAIPHLTKLQKKYPDVPIVSVAVADEPGAVYQFLDKNKARMGYTVAIDDGDWMGENWMQASGQSGIPVAYIVGKDGRIEWIGHSMALEDPLAKVRAGKWDRAAAVKAHEATLNEARKSDLAGRASQALYEDRDYDLTIKLADELIKEGSSTGHLRKIQALLRKMDGAGALKEIAATEKKGRYTGMTDNWRYQALVILGRYEEARKLGARLVNAGDSFACRKLAWDIIDPEMPYKKRDLDLAQKAINKALADDKGPANLRTQAWIYYFKGDLAKAKSTHAKALKLMDDQQVRSKWEALFQAHAG